MFDTITRLNAAPEGRYRTERELGEGGTATVFVADDVEGGQLKRALDAAPHKLAGGESTKAGSSGLMYHSAPRTALPEARGRSMRSEYTEQAGSQFNMGCAPPLSTAGRL